MHRNEMELKFTAVSENESFARTVVGSFVMMLDPSLEEYAEIKTVVSEVVTNAIIHGYGGSSRGYVHLKAEIDTVANSIVIEIWDKGCGIADLDEARQPLFTSKPELERSGMGFTIMENFSDFISIESEVGVGTKVTITKYFSKNNAIVY